MYTKKIGVGIFTFNRPHYLKRLLQSMRTQVDPGDYDVHFFCDGAINIHNRQKRAEQKDIDATIAVAKAEVPVENFRAHVQPKNRGIAVQQYEAYNYLAKGYDYAIWLDDDVELGPYWFRTARLMADELEKHQNWVSASPMFTKCCAKGTEFTSLSKYKVGNFPWIGFIMDMRMWPELRAVYQDYYDLVKDRDYRSRPHEKIRALYKKHGYEKPHSSQDAGKEMSIRRLGWRRIKMLVNRGRYIGEHGEHGRPDNYRAQGWQNHWKIDWAGDADTADLERILPDDPPWHV